MFNMILNESVDYDHLYAAPCIAVMWFVDNYKKIIRHFSGKSEQFYRIFEHSSIRIARFSHCALVEFQFKKNIYWDFNWHFI